MPTLFDELSATTRAAIEQDVVQDNLFVEDGLQKVVRYYANEITFTGGLFMQEPFVYDRPTGGASVPGSTRTVKDKQLLAAFAFSPREYIEEIPINEWKNDVINTGPNAAVSIYDAYMELAVKAFNTDWNIDAYRHGQTSATLVQQDRTTAVNGMDEFLNDGVRPGWMGNVYTTIGGETRNGTVGNALNSIPLWAGDQSGAVGQVSYLALLRGYMNCFQPPDTGLCNRELFSLIAAREEPKQRFAQETDVRIGVTGFKIMDAYIHRDLFAPSTKWGGMLSSNLYPSTLVPADIPVAALPTTTDTLGGWPTQTTAASGCKVGEPFFWLRLKDWKMRPAASAKFRHYFKGPIPSQEAPDLEVMFYREALNWYTPSPRDNSQMVGFGF
jgi:hypothetical protein